jgi:hypothetical protein
LRLAASNGQVFDLTFVGYQFPSPVKSQVDDDSDWLLIRVDVVHPRGPWTASDPALLAHEVTRLADWLDSLAGGAQAEDEEAFLEPCLMFRIVESDGVKCLRVYFELELRPPWAAASCAGQEDLWVEFPLHEIDLREAARSLRESVTRYPHRTEV